MMKTISLKISKSLEQRLQQSAAEAGVNKSELLRQALERHLSQSKTANKSSVVALAGNLVGCFCGPTDLSTNADYFDEFGQ